MQKRYEKLIQLIHENKPATIIEIGVWNGKRAIEMCSAALKHQKEVHYTGYDLFDEATPELDAAELNFKKTNTLSQVRARLEDFKKRSPGFTFDLVKGNTRKTLEPTKADFVYIDGGHSVETIRSDYEAVKMSPVVVFDDYYAKDRAGRCPDLKKFGANEIVDAIPRAQLFECADPVKGGGLVWLAIVKTRPRGRKKLSPEPTHEVEDAKPEMAASKPMEGPGYEM